MHLNLFKGHKYVNVNTKSKRANNVKAYVASQGQYNPLIAPHRTEGSPCPFTPFLSQQRDVVPHLVDNGLDSAGCHKRLDLKQAEVAHTDSSDEASINEGLHGSPECDQKGDPPVIV